MALSTPDMEPRALSGDDLKRAKSAAGTLARYLEHERGASVEIEVRPEHGQEPYRITVPGPVFQMLADILAQMSQGSAVAVLPYHAELTTQQAAEILNVSRPYVVRLMESGDLPYRKVGPRRRILLCDLMAYKHADDARRRGVAAELTQEAERLGLGY